MTVADVQLLYEKGPCLAVLKPPGLLTQAPPGIDSMEVRLKRFLKRRENKQGNIYLGVPHRLDRPASGVMLFARHVRAARRLSEQFENRQVRKLYWVCVAGQVDPPSGTWRDRLIKVPGEARAEVVASDEPTGRDAVLHYRTLGMCPGGTWLEVELETGRTHQVRVQASSRGYPVLGDEQYGSQRPFGPPLEDPRLRPIALHARCLEFCHPMTREPTIVTAPVPEDWQPLGLG